MGLDPFKLGGSGSDPRSIATPRIKLKAFCILSG